MKESAERIKAVGAEHFLLATDLGQTGNPSPPDGYKLLVGGLLGLLASWACSLPTDAWFRALAQERLKIDLKESLFSWPYWLVLCGPINMP